MTLAARLEHTKKRLAAERLVTAALKGKLAALDIEPVDEPAPWMAGLEPRHVTLMTILLEAKCRAVQLWALDDNLPKQERVNAADNYNRLRIAVSQIRGVLGESAIETVPGGYRCSKAFFNQYGKAA